MIDNCPFCSVSLLRDVELLECCFCGYHCWLIDPKYHYYESDKNVMSYLYYYEENELILKGQHGVITVLPCFSFDEFVQLMTSKRLEKLTVFL